MLPALHFGASRELLGPFRTRAPLMAVCVLMVSLVMGVNAYLAITFVTDLPPKAQLAVSCYMVFYLFVCLRIVLADFAAIAQFSSGTFRRVRAAEHEPMHHDHVLPWCRFALARETRTPLCTQWLSCYGTSSANERSLEPLKEKLLWPKAVAK